VGDVIRVGRSGGTLRVAAVIVSVGLMLLFGWVPVWFGALLSMNADHCTNHDQRPICSPATQNLVAHLPLWGLLVGLLLSGGLGGVTLHQHRAPYLWVVLGWVLFVAAMVASWTIADAGNPY
jgi:hypothetical protein